MRHRYPSKWRYPWLAAACALAAAAMCLPARDPQSLATHPDYYGAGFVDRGRIISWAEMPERSVPEPRPESFSAALQNWNKGPKSAYRARWLVCLARNLSEANLALDAFLGVPPGQDRAAALYGRLLLHNRVVDQDANDAKVPGLVPLRTRLSQSSQQGLAEAVRLSERSLPLAIIIADGSSWSYRLGPGRQVLKPWLERLPKTSRIRIVQARSLLRSTVVRGKPIDADPAEAFRMLQPLPPEDPQVLHALALTHVSWAEFIEPVKNQATAIRLFRRLLRHPQATRTMKDVATRYLRDPRYASALTRSQTWGRR